MATYLSKDSHEGVSDKTNPYQFGIMINKRVIYLMGKKLNRSLSQTTALCVIRNKVSGTNMTQEAAQTPDLGLAFDCIKRPKYQHRPKLW